MKERVAQFGPGQGLIGIETPSVGSENDPDRPTWILLNAGIIHRVGPHRLTVNLAHRISRAGFPALRFDLSGVGDSRPRSAATFEQAAIQDICDAMDYLERTNQACRFVLCGLCSGADNSVRAALVDPRIVGIALLDPHSYPTIGFHLRRLLQRVSSLSSWKTLAKRMGGMLRRIARPRRQSAVTGGPPPLPDNTRPRPEQSAFAADLRTIIDRGAHILVVYSGGMECNYAGQFNAAFRRYGLSGRISVEFLPSLNHDCTEMAQQRRLGDLLVAWAEGLFPAAPANQGRQVGSVG
jgi:pimeloyl-ACP methyl ester carboxylesterase